METNNNKINNLFNELRNLGFWARLFQWKRIRIQLMDAGADLVKLQTNLEHLKDDCVKTELRYEKKSAADVETIANLAARKAELDLELGRLRKEDEFRKQELGRSMSTLKDIKDQFDNERKKEKLLQTETENFRLQQIKETWNNHEATVRHTIRAIAMRHGIEMIEQVPFKGTPDNTLRICEEFMLFDAKSPAGEDMSNFPAYLRDQSEKAVKYAREENVHKDIFFVVPSNTLKVIRQHVYRLAAYNVFVISLDALEPVILAYQKLEAYEFAKQLSPEERENICRVLGKFAHLAKRRIQVDHFFIRQFMELAYKAETDLPAEILDQVLEFEKAEKLNPPIERRAKQISLKELEKDAERINQDTISKGIAMIEQDISAGLNKLPLYSGE